MKTGTLIATLVVLVGASGIFHVIQQSRVRSLESELRKSEEARIQASHELRLHESRLATDAQHRAAVNETAEARQRGLDQRIIELERANARLETENLALQRSLQVAERRPAPAATPTVTRQPVVKRVEPTPPQVWQQPGPPVQLIHSTARRRAETYCETQRKAGSGSTLVFDTRVDFIGEPREVPGWTGRYEVAGEVSFKYYDSIWGGSFSSDHLYFTAQVEVNGRAAKIVDFTPRSTEPLGF
ncbi:MAG: hypothetical protein NVV63_03595 [Opitutus sp.]|nr:hypothetical protein [Opitutus sp.]